MNKITSNILMSVILIIFISLAISGFQFIAHEVISFSNYLMTLNIFISLLIILLTLGFVIGLTYINNKIKGYNGGGVAQFEAYFDHNKEFNPLYMFALIFINTIFAFFSGLSLGAEGPSVAIAGSVGYYFSNKFKIGNKEYTKVACSTGFAVAFLAPLAGLFHLIEENKTHLSLSLIFKGIVIIIPSCIISYYIYNHNMLEISASINLPFNLYYILIILIVVAILISYFFKYLIIFIKDLNKKWNFMVYLTLLLVVISLLLKKYYPDLVGSGSNFLTKSYFDYSLILIALLLIGKLVLIAFSANSTLSGGIVLPMIAIGAISADFVTNILINFIPDIYLYSELLKVILMVTVFALVTRCPLTSFILGLKCGDFLVVALPLFIVITISYIITYFMKDVSIYKLMVKRMDIAGEH